MIMDEVLKNYKSGKLSTEELKKKIKEVQSLELVRKPLSIGQKGLWMLDKTSPGSTAYNLPICLRVHKRLNSQLLQQAFHYVTKQYPILKTVIEEQDGIPYQVLCTSWKLDFQDEEIECLTQKEITDKLRNKAKEPFVLEQGPLMRVYLLKGTKESIILINIHHIIFDGSSIGILVDSLLNAYYELSHGNLPLVEKQLTDFYDYVEWEKKMLADERGTSHRAYWKKQLSGNLPVIELPEDYKRHASIVFDAKTENIKISGETMNKVRKCVKNQRITLSTFFLGILNILLYQYSGQKDIIVGMVNRGRPEECFESTIGYFINMIPVRCRIQEDETFQEFVKNLQLTMFDGMDHSEYPFPEIVKDLNLPRNLSGTPVFQIGYFYQNYIPDESIRIQNVYEKELPFEYIEDIHQEGEYELTFEVFEHEKEFVLHFKYNSALYKQSTIKRIAENFVRLVEEVATNADMQLNEYSGLSKEEEKIIIYDWNTTDSEYPKEKCVYDLFREQARKTPNAKAVIYENESLTYKELDERSTKLAVYLQKLGVTGDSLVGISTERSLDMLVGLLGIMKAGGAYIPLDPLYPKERIEYMIENSQMSIIVSQLAVTKKLGNLFDNVQTVVNIDTQWQEIEQSVQNLEELKKLSDPNNLAYVLYTSGSTGNPKGVMISHRALVNFLIQMADKPGLTAQDKLLAVTTFCFDISGLELYLPLIQGAKCYLISNEKQKNIEALKYEIKRIQPTIMQATPATWTALYKLGWKNEEGVKILCGGEALPEKLKNYFIDSNSEVWNMFGPTETTIWSTMKKITKDDAITIGKPIANTQCYILNQYGKPVPIGVPGELYIGGDGLARGYLNLEKTTKERFVENPFKKNGRLYKTGDFAKWLDTGEIEFIGRMDNQVKIRGYRIELSEIETRMNLYPGIQESVVVISEDDGNKQLRAFYLKKDSKEENSLNVKELKNYLKKWLPDYMVPVVFTELDTIPLTPNGKVNRLLLSEYKVDEQAKKEEKIEEKTLENRQKELISETQETIKTVWKGIVGNDDFTLNDGFFEIGGDSITAVTAVERINKKLNCKITVTNLFEYSSVNTLSNFIAELKKQETPQNQSFYKEKSVIEHIDAKSDIPDYYEDSVAIIGIACEVPGADSYEKFWDNLLNNKESHKYLSEEEQIQLKVPKDLMENPKYVPIQLSIEGKELFDPEFFKISPKDAEFMDPQMRHLIQASWKAVEDAGYISSEIPNTAVYMSASNNYYNTENDTADVSIMEDSESYVKWLYSQGGTIPTMISYKLGLKGPSYFVHSNCSSGLVGMYQAYQSICAGKVDYALVGASTLRSLPDAGYVYVPGLNFSSDGHIKAFDSSADGMVGGEGAAVVLLKNAKKAVENGDHIYGVLRGIELNNDGSDKVGFYAPGVKGQAEVIAKTLESTKINPETISYVETHGTGTKLGDPIEFSALCNAYRKYTDKKKYCGIGSVKTNIGHLDTVAGIVGCIKVILSLYHKKIPASLNYKNANKEIDFTNSPFYVVTETQKLKEQDSPYRASLSSFGIGGTNGHAIFEQYKQNCTMVEDDENTEYFIPVSAKSEERLKEYIKNILQHLNEQDDPMLTIRNISYTLQTGRTAMDKRVMFIVRSISELKEKFSLFLDEQKVIDNCYRKSVKVEMLDTTDFNNSDLKKLMEDRKYEKIASLWVNGANLNWNEFYDKNGKYHKVRLPTYPFARESYWKNDLKELESKPYITNGLHILIDKNISNFMEQKYAKAFTGREFYLVDHIINHQKVLPGVIHIEMARAACELAMEQKVYKIKNIIWARPVLVESPQQVEIALLLQGRDVTYQIRSNENGKIVIHSQGKAEYQYDLQPDEEIFDIESCKESCSDYLEHKGFYEGSGDSVYEYGITFRPIQEMFIGEDEILSRIEVPTERHREFNAFTLHPSLLEGCLQTTVALMHRKSTEPFMPFAIEEIEILQELPKSCYVYATYAPQRNKDTETKKFHIWLLDSQGHVLVKIKNYSVRTILPEPVQTEKLTDILGSVYYRDIWKKEESDINIENYTGALVVFDDSQELCCELEKKDRLLQVKTGEQFRVFENGVYEMNPNVPEHYRRLLRALKAEKCIPNRIVYNWHKEAKDLDNALENSIYRIFGLTKALVTELPKEKVKLLILNNYKENVQTLLYEALSGLVKTVNKEFSKYYFKAVELKTDYVYMNEILDYEFSATDGEEICYTDEGRFVRQITEYDIEKETRGMPSPFRNQGVYLITGGMGKLATLLAEYLAERYQARLILLGRSSLNESQKNEISRIESLGGEVMFIQADVSNQNEVNDAVKQARQVFNKIHGVFHCAGTIRDHLIKDKTYEELDAVIHSKVKGAVYLDEALKDEPLDFFTLFSSTSYLGNAGQADYAYANSFLNRFANYREELCGKEQRYGKTVSMSWPLWKDGGMTMREETIKLLRTINGCVPLPNEVGLKAIEQMLLQKHNHIILQYGETEKIKNQKNIYRERKD